MYILDDKYTTFGDHITVRCYKLFKYCTINFFPYKIAFK